MSNVDVAKIVGTELNEFIITQYIGSGSFGNVFEAKHKKSGRLVALKIPVKTDEKDGLKSIIDEAKIYKKISSPENGVANMKVSKHDNRHFMVMDLLGPSLESLITKHKKFGLKTVIQTAISMISIMKYIHSCGFIHRDIKPDNFVIGHEDKSKLYCIDFGISKKYMKRNGEHIKLTNTRKFCGTARYASVSAHDGNEQSRRDDMESLGYIFVYLYKGRLPWQGIKHKEKKERYRLIGEKKKNTREEDLCVDMPKEFLVYMKYIRTMDFDEKPHYSALIKMFKKLYESKNYKNDKCDWEVGDD